MRVGGDGPETGATDALLVERTRRGDSTAFETLVRRHYRAAYAVALAQLGNRMDAEDVCQDAFMRALERLEDCDPEKFVAWLLQIVRNRAHNARDYRRVRSGPPLDEVITAGRADSHRDAERAELGTMLERALGQLSEIQRQVVLLHDLEGCRHREIAEALGLSEGMSRQHLFAARRILRDQLGSTTFKEYVND